MEHSALDHDGQQPESQSALSVQSDRASVWRPRLINVVSLPWHGMAGRGAAVQQCSVPRILGPVPVAVKPIPVPGQGPAGACRRLGVVLGAGAGAGRLTLA